MATPTGAVVEVTGLACVRSVRGYAVAVGGTRGVDSKAATL